MIAIKGRVREKPWRTFRTLNLAILVLFSKPFQKLSSKNLIKG